MKVRPAKSQSQSLVEVVGVLSRLPVMLKLSGITKVIPLPPSLLPESSSKTSGYTVRVCYSIQCEGTWIPWPWGVQLETPR